MDRFFGALIAVLALTAALAAPPAFADVLWDDVPAYDQADLPGMCSETSTTMVLGWHDTNRFKANWKRFVPWGGNLQALNIAGIGHLEWDIVTTLGTDVEPFPDGDGKGDGMNDRNWESAETLLPQLLSSADPGAAFTLNYRSRHQGDALSIEEIATALASHGPGVFGTWSTVYYYDNSGGSGDFSQHDTAAIGYFQAKAPAGLDLPAPPPIQTTSNWLVVQSTWSSDAWGGFDPLWINTTIIKGTDEITYADFAPGGTPSTTVDDTDDPYEDNDGLEHPAEVSWPLALTGMRANDLDVFSVPVPAGHQTITLAFQNAQGDLDLQVNLPDGQILHSATLNDREEVSFDLDSPGDCKVLVVPFGANTYSLSSGPLPGDVDRDGARTLADLVLILQASSGVSSPPDLQEETLTPALAALVLQALAGLR